MNCVNILKPLAIREKRKIRTVHSLCYVLLIIYNISFVLKFFFLEIKYTIVADTANRGGKQRVQFDDQNELVRTVTSTATTECFKVDTLHLVFQVCDV